MSAEEGTGIDKLDDEETKIKDDETSQEVTDKPSTPEAPTDTGQSETQDSEPPKESIPQDTEPDSKQESESRPESRPKTQSSTSSSARRKKKDAAEDENVHKVTFTVTIAKAIPTAEEDREDGSVIDGEKKKRRIVEAPRAQNYYHLEYNLLPDEEEPVKTDVVAFGLAAKIYTEKQEAKVLKTWPQDDVTWMAWTHNHSMTITEDILLKLFKHNLQLRIWDTKDKLSARAKFDRPKAFRLPQAKPGQDEENVGGVKGIVTKVSSSFEAAQPKRSYIDRPLPTHPRPPPDENRVKHTDAKHKHRPKKDQYKPLDRLPHKPLPSIPASRDGKPTPSALVGVPKQDSQEDGEHGSRTYSRLAKLAGADSPLGTQEGGRASKRVQSADPATASRALDSRGSRSAYGDGAGSSTGPSRMKGSAMSSRKDHSPTRQDENGPPMRSTSNLVKHKSLTKLSSKSTSLETVYEREEAASPAGSSLSRGKTPSIFGKGKNKKKEAAAQSAQEHIKKYGVACLSIPMAKFFSGIDCITERLDKSLSTISDAFISVSLNTNLMSADQCKKLNPLVVKVHSATNMPNTPMPFQELKQRCQPAFVKYSLYKQPSHSSVGREQDSSIYWDDINVLLTGTVEPSELRQYLNGPLLDIEIHDRDRMEEKQKLKPTLFGDDLEDEKISNVGIVTSKRTLHNPFEGRDKPWDPFGVAKFDLSGLLLGQQILHLKSPIHMCHIPDVLGMRDGKQDGKLMGYTGAVDGPIDSPLPAGHYLENNAMLKIKVELAHPLILPQELAAKQDLPSTKECPFGRIVFRFAYKNVGFLHKLQDLLSDINSEALGLSDMPPHVIEVALSTYKLSIEQQKSRDLNIVTGFHVLDGEIHLFVLEGLRDSGIQRIWNTMPKPETDRDVTVLYNSDLSFSDRLYGPLDVDVCRIKLHEPLAIIVQQPLLYVRDMVPKPCFSALVKLRELCQVSKLKDACRSDILPAADMVVSMSREFGVPITADDFEDLQPEQPKMADTGDKQTTFKMPTTTRMWTPIDNSNEEYFEKIQDREKGGRIRDYHIENKKSVEKQSRVNQLQRSYTAPQLVRAKVQVAHNYSTQTLNSTDLAKEDLRQKLAQDPDKRFTYCPDFHHSMTVVPVNVDAVKKAEAEASKKAWKTEKGFTYPGKKTMIESNKHPQKPDPARVDELKEDWEENRLFAVNRPILERDVYSWPHRHEDMDLWKKPDPIFGSDEPHTIMLAGQKQKNERDLAMKKDLDTWKSKILVSDPRPKFHRLATETELRDKGFKSSNQIDRLSGVLKDPPQKLTLKRLNCEIPPLNVVLNPSVDTIARDSGRIFQPSPPNEADERVKGFHPGPYEGYSWTVKRNMIPVRDYEHQKFSASRGHDFNVYHRERSNLYKRPITTITGEEYETHLFSWPPRTEESAYAHGFVIPSIQDFKDRQHTKDSGLGPSITSKETTMLEAS